VSQGTESLWRWRCWAAHATLSQSGVAGLSWWEARSSFGGRMSPCESVLAETAMSVERCNTWGIFECAKSDHCLSQFGKAPLKLTWLPCIYPIWRSGPGHLALATFNVTVCYVSWKRWTVASGENLPTFWRLSYENKQVIPTRVYYMCVYIYIYIYISFFIYVYIYFFIYVYIYICTVLCPVWDLFWKGDISEVIKNLHSC